MYQNVAIYIKRIEDSGLKLIHNARLNQTKIVRLDTLQWSEIVYVERVQGTHQNCVRHIKRLQDKYFEIICNVKLNEFFFHKFIYR